MELAPRSRALLARALAALAALAGFGLTVGEAAGQQQLIKLLASDGTAYQGLGHSVSASGELALVGASGDNQMGVASGAAYVFDVGTGEQLFKLTASDARPQDYFGLSVAISGELAVVGAHGSDAAGPGAGAAYVFDAGTGRELFKLMPSELAAGDKFGRSVAISGDLGVVGAPGHDHLAPDSGAAWVFHATDGSLWPMLVAMDGATGDGLGGSVAISGERAVVGAPVADAAGTNSGAAYVFDTNTGQQLFKLLSSDIAPNDLFGGSVAAAGGRALVGALEADGDWGAAYLFDLATGQQLFKLAAPNDGGVHWFGVSVALSGDRAVVGDLAAGQTGSGKAYVFDVLTGQLLYDLEPLDGALGDRFGTSVALSGARALAGAPWDDDLGTSSGSAYVFDVPQTTGSAYCFGDGSGSACPCGNPGGAGQGCANSTGAGALLWAAGSPSASADELVLYAAELVPAQPALLFAGLNAVGGGDGAPLGDGLRCAGGGVVRLGVALPTLGGAAIWGPGLAERGGFVAGDLRRFQAWYRDPAGPCASGANLSNGLEVFFAP